MKLPFSAVRNILFRDAILSPVAAQHAAAPLSPLQPSDRDGQTEFTCPHTRNNSSVLFFLPQIYTPVPPFHFINPKINPTPHPLNAKAPHFSAGLCARNWIRTSTSFRTLPPEDSASTNFAIRASE